MRLGMSPKARLFVIAFVEQWTVLIQRQRLMGKQYYFIR